MAPIATLSGYDWNAGIPVDIYTVPAGKTLVVTDVVVRVDTIGTISGDGDYYIKRHSDDGLVSHIGDQYPSVTGEYRVEGPAAPGLLVVAGDILYIDPLSADSGSGDTMSIDILGYLV